VGYLSRRVLVMYLGRLVEEGETSKVLEKPKHPYTRALLESSRTRRSPITGEPPNPAQKPSGCPFHTRCAYAEDRCGRENQELLQVEPGWKVACWKWDQIQAGK